MRSMVEGAKADRVRKSGGGMRVRPLHHFVVPLPRFAALHEGGLSNDGTGR